MVDILFLAKGRKEFTEASLTALMASLTATPALLHVVEDADGPVAGLNYILNMSDANDVDFIAKIDNDTIVPPGWLSACLDVMTRYPEVDLLGLEAWAPDEKLWPSLPQPNGDAVWWAPTYDPKREIRKVSHVGGIGVFRRSAFERFGKPTPNSTDGRYGFTEWQWANPSMVKAFLDPPLPVFLLDHLPFEPWISLDMRYEQMGQQRRQWGFYDPIKHKALWDWWLK